MATTAHRSRGDPEDDIAAIAKQISDQAEAIYQNWKSRGLGPADLISCHAAGGDTTKLGSMLKPQSASVKTSSMELLAQAPSMDNNKLETLVKNFVVEDKARLAARSSVANRTMPSSIQFALEKFEKNNTEASGKPSFLCKQHIRTNENFEHLESTSTIQMKPSINKKPQISPKPRLNSSSSSTPETTTTTTATVIPRSTPTLNSESPVLQSWPLKNRIITTENVKKSLQEPLPSRINNKPQENTLKQTTTNTVIEQVVVEENRLLTALKKGIVSDEVPTSSLFVSAKGKQIDRGGGGGGGGGEVSTTKWGGLRNTRKVEQSVPHPELTISQRQHLRQTAANPVRPFLTRGSVAERVLIFEKCPSDLLLDKKVRTSSSSVQSIKPQQFVKQQIIPHTTLQRHVKAHRNVIIPRFHYPKGKPVPITQLDATKSKLKIAFGSIGAPRASREHFVSIVNACELPLYWKIPLYLAACADKETCTFEQFMTFWSGMCGSCHDDASRFIYILTRGTRNSLMPEDFIPLVQDVVETHPGLTFLKEATEFHSRYVHTVIARIYYCVNRSWSGRISLPELRRSDLLNIIQLLEEEEDINQITQYFSYEHFYVIYCKFWELDRDHDLFIDKHDLTRHNDNALSSRIIERIFSGCVTRGQKRSQHDERMSYTEFVWFLLSEEDKLHPTAIEYWFRCMDLDGDGYLSMYELEYFYEEQMQRMEAIGIETLPFQDCLCQMLDMVKPKILGKIRLSDLKQCKMTSLFFDTFFNLEKYLDHEQRDPFATQRERDEEGHEMSDWDKYASEEYELLVAEEGGNDVADSLDYECGFDRLVR